MLLAFNLFGQPVKNVYYVSSSVGDDANDGSIEKPFRTVNNPKIPHKDVIIRLKCGDVFFESLSGYTGVVIESYGRGERPVLCGFKVLENPSAWVQAGENLWKLDMFRDDCFSGFNDDIEHLNDIGCIYMPDSNRMFGHIVQHRKDLKASGDIFLTDKFKQDDMDPETFRYVTLYYDGNPAELGKMCFSVCSHGISGLDSCEVKNITVRGFSKHGISGINNSLIENCTVDVIGGSVQMNTPNWVRYGNGIEFWISASPLGNTVVRNCVISRTYDCGSTIQGSSVDKRDPENILFEDNMFLFCRQAFEHFLNSSNRTPLYANCGFTDNICFRMGENMFSSPEGRDAAVLSYEHGIKNIAVKGNIFYGSSYYCSRLKPVGMTGNKVYIYPGQYLNHCHYVNGYDSIYVEDEKSIEKYRQWSMDDSDIRILERGSKKDRRIGKSVARKIYRKADSLQRELLKDYL